ncbi:MAG: hypothetical protein MZW92_14850 [Comamonadaceae bacterium]|nr:hypothetical protein [Comamonadaceae bacterium]
MSSARWPATRHTLGADAPPGCYDDIDHAATACSSPARTRPTRTRSLFRRIEDARARESRPEADRRRPAPHRDRAPTPTCTCRSCPAPTWRCSTPCCT